MKRRLPLLSGFTAPLAFASLSLVAACTASVGGLGDDAHTLVAVGAGGTILSSEDGISWGVEDSTLEISLASVASGRSLFVAVGQGGAVLSSPDGRDWTRRDSQTEVDLRHVVYTGQKFVAVGGDWEEGAVTIVSDDGLSWTMIPSPPGYMFHAVAHQPQAVVVAGYTRSDRQEPSLFHAPVSAGSSVVGTWDQKEGPDFYDSLSFGDLILTVGRHVYSSENGADWSSVEIEGASLLYSITNGPEGFVVVGERDLFHSADGEVWTRGSTNLRDGWFRSVSAAPMGFVAVGGKGLIARSTDGLEWARVSIGTTEDLIDVTSGPHE